MEIYSCKVNHLKNPLGFVMTDTVFSWKVRDAMGKKQTAARIQVALDEAFTRIITDTGFQPELDSLAAPVDMELRPYTRYYWKVTVRTDAETEDGSAEEAVSETQWFETAKMGEAWAGKWITCDSREKRHPYFEKAVAPGKEVSQARLYVCGLGLYEAYYNGEKIGEEYLTPYSNNYNSWVQYQTYDVTEALQQEGTLSILLGNGWYKGRFGFTAKEEKGYYGNEWKLIAELRLLYADGTVETIGTDESWQVRRSNIVFSSLYDGEQADDTLEPLPAERVLVCEAPKGRLMERKSLPVCVKQTLCPVELIHTPAGETVLDMGQEFAGIFTLKADVPAGTEVIIQTGEILQQGNFYNDNLRSAKSEYRYISAGYPVTIRPRFTYYGYRYVKIQGIADLRPEDFTGLALYSDIEDVGGMETGNALVNRFISNVRWGLRSNFLDVPTDCPQRDERMGWTGDAQVFSPTAMYLTDSYAFYEKYLYDMDSEQRQLGGMVPNVVPSAGITEAACAWGDAACIIPWNMYLFYGDRSILRRQYASMKAWVDYVRGVDGEEHGWRKRFHFGDWLALDHPRQDAEQMLGGTDEDFLANLYYAVSAGLVAEAAAVLGHEEDRAAYQALHDEQIAEVKREYYSVTGRCCIKTQTALLLTLKYHLSDNEELIKRQLERLFWDCDYKFRTGFIGTPILCHVLSDYGMSGLAYKLLLNEEYPGWLHEVKLGATTVWERWNSVLDDGSISGTGMNSLNHYAYGSVLEWMFAHGAGLKFSLETRGGKTMKIVPELNLELQELKAFYDSPAGEYRMHWRIPDNNHVEMTVQVPFGAQAALMLPYASPETYEDRENPMFADVRDGMCLLAAGTYHVAYETAEPLKKEDVPVMKDPWS
ncbi:MAG: glycoside hydrolase family 78 protein [Blautia sp.]|nr:glycoside hydrolase family 78 protein [Blautia sp.]MCM1201128.1 glycoside hydrolase family 78 protein [Bacteroides fragilis]